MTVTIATIRGYLSGDPIKALALVDALDDVAVDYVCRHLKISLDRLPEVRPLAWRAVELRGKKDWRGSHLNDLPDPVLRWFASECATRACIRGQVDDERSIRAVMAAQLHALGMIDDKALAETRNAAWYAARAAARAAAWYAAENAAWYAAENAERGWQIAELSRIIERYALWGVGGLNR